MQTIFDDNQAVQAALQQPPPLPDWFLRREPPPLPREYLAASLDAGRRWRDRLTLAVVYFLAKIR